MEQLFEWLAVGKCDEEDARLVEALVEEYPYFAAPRLLCLKRAFDAGRPAYLEKLGRHAIHVPDHKQLYRYLHRLPPFEEAATVPQVFEFIRGEAAATTPRVVPPYRLEDEFPGATGEEREDEDPIDIFIREEPVMPRVVPGETGAANEPRHVEEEFFSETLAKIYVKQKLYDKAIATYMKLSLKYPGKSIYFARLIENTNELIKNNTQ
jgi:hypothetical protein